MQLALLIASILWQFFIHRNLNSSIVKTLNAQSSKLSMLNSHNPNSSIVTILKTAFSTKYVTKVVRLYTY